MPFVRVDFAVEGDKQISRAFEVYGTEADDLREPLSDMADVILDSIREQFATQGQSGLGSRWKALNPDYAAWKLAHFGPRPILVRTGGMKGAMLNKSSAVTITRRRMVYEPLNSYAAHHQRGDGHLPQRKMVSLTVAQKRAAVDRVFSAWLINLRAQAGLGR